jgi:hypothetical protein
VLIIRQVHNILWCNRLWTLWCRLEDVENLVPVNPTCSTAVTRSCLDLCQLALFIVSIKLPACVNFEYLEPLNLTVLLPLLALCLLYHLLVLRTNSIWIWSWGRRPRDESK